MDNPLWAAVDEYVRQQLSPPDPILDAALESSEAGGLPAIAVSPPQGKLLQLLARLQGARRVLEIGTLGGYSTICLARGVGPNGRVVTLEIEPAHARVAAANIARAGFADQVEIRVGVAIETLARMVEEGEDPFDLIFVDADKPTTPAYFEWALRLSRVGSVIIVDNVVREGEVIDAESEDPRVQGVRRLHEAVGSNARVSATTIQTVGGKGYDGLLVAVVVA